MWYACIACSTVCDSQEQLDKHYQRPSRKECRKVLQLRNKLKRRKAHKLPVVECKKIVHHRRIRRSSDKGKVEAQPGVPNAPKPYFCSQCSATFDDEENHKKTHEAPGDINDIKKLYNCAQLIKHGEVQPVKCTYCDNFLPTHKRLRQHVILMHPEVREKLLNLIKKIESFQILSNPEDEKEEAIGSPSRSKRSKPSHFSLQEYSTAEIPNWAAELQKLNFVSQVLLPSTLARFSQGANTSTQVPANVLPPETEGSPRSISSHKENAVNEPSIEVAQSGQEQLNSPLSIQVGESSSPSSGVKTRSQSSSPVANTSTPAAASVPRPGPSRSQSSQGKIKKPHKKRLNHMCFFCGMKFPRESRYLVHIMFTHTKPKTKADKEKMKRYIEILSTRLEIDSINSPDKNSSRNKLTSAGLNLTGKKRGADASAEPFVKKLRFEEKEKLPEVSLEDIGDKIMMDCPACSASIALSSRICHMEAHLDSIDTNLSDTPICLICGFQAKDLTKLKEHASRHFNVKPFGCDHCWAGFTQGSSLQLHMRKAHKPVKPGPKTRKAKDEIMPESGGKRSQPSTSPRNQH